MKEISLDSETELPSDLQHTTKRDGYWMGLIVVLIIFSQSLFYFYTHRGWRTLDTSVGAITVDHQGTIFAAGMDGALYQAEGARLVLYGDGSVRAPLAADETVTALMVDTLDRIWVGTSLGWVARLGRDGEWLKVAPKMSHNSQMVIELLQDRSGVVWVRGKPGLGRIDWRKDPKTYAYDNPGLDYEAIDIALDSRGLLWAIDSKTRKDANGNLEVLSERNVKVLNPDGVWRTKAEGRLLSRLAVDDQGRLWIGKPYPEGDEVNMWDGNTWVRYSFDDNPNMGGSVIDMSFDAQGRLWVASHGLHRLDVDATWHNYERRNSVVPRVAMQDIVLDGQGRVWIRAFRGLLVVFEVGSSFPPVDTLAMRLLGVLPLMVIPIAVLGISRSTSRNSAFRQQNIMAFSKGLWSWYAVHTLFWFVVGFFIAPLGGPGASAFYMICGFVPLVPNLVIFFMLLRRRSTLAWGLPAAYITNITGHLLIDPGGFSQESLLNLIGMLPYF